MRDTLQGQGWLRWQMGGNYFAWGYSDTANERWLIASHDEFATALQEGEAVYLGLYEMAHLGGDEPLFAIEVPWDDFVARHASDWIDRLVEGSRAITT